MKRKKYLRISKNKVTFTTEINISQTIIRYYVKLKHVTMSQTQPGNVAPLPATNVIVRARASYLHIWEPTSVRNDPMGKKTYNGNFLIPKSDVAAVKAVQDAFKAAYDLGMLTDNAKKSLRNVNPASMQRALRDADVDPKRQNDPVYKGHWYIAAKNPNQPGILGGDKKPLTDKTKIYSGCYVYVDLNFFPFNNIQQGIGCGFNNIMFAADGESLGGQIDAESAFAGIPATAPSFGPAPTGNPFGVAQTNLVTPGAAAPEPYKPFGF